MENWRSEIEPQQCLDWALNIMAWGITSDKLSALALETVLVNSLVRSHFFLFLLVLNEVLPSSLNNGLYCTYQPLMD